MLHTAQYSPSSSALMGSLLLACLLASSSFLAAGSTVGVNYSGVADNLPSLSDVVNLLKANNVNKVRIFDADAGVLSAFDNSGIRLIVAVPNGDLESVSSSQDAANQWVQSNIVPHSSIIEYIAVGNEVLISNQGFAQYLVQAMQNIQNALDAANLGSIKVSTTHSTAVLDSSSFPPSKGVFQSQIINEMSAILDFNARTGSGFMANVYPFFAYRGANGGIDLNYAVFGQAQGVDDGSVHYSNLFDAQVDTLIAAMAAAGHGDVGIIVTESGWPWQGDGAATLDNAKRYNTGLVNHVPSGTPKRPGFIQAYIFELFNEDQKNGDPYERFWGVFNADQTKVYDITL